LDLGFCKYWQQLLPVQAIVRIDRMRMVCMNRYPFGLALLRFPVMGLLVDTSSTSGQISRSEHIASVILSSLALVAICVLAIATCRLLQASRFYSQLGVLAFVFGTGLFHYATFDGSFTHIYSALLVAVLVYLAVRAWKLERPLPMVTTALASFILVAIRNTNLALVGLILTAYFLRYRFVQRASWRRFGALVLREGAPVAIGSATALGLQVAYNSWASGNLTFSSYGWAKFDFAKPMQVSIIASYERGLFTYYPVLGLALLIGLVVRRTRIGTAWFSLMLVCYVVIYGFWTIWYLGQGMGHRGFVELMPLGIPIFAVAATELSVRLRRMVVLATILCIAITVQITIGYWRNRFPREHARGADYWSQTVGEHSVIGAIISGR
jgi:hypothetical protein